MTYPVNRIITAYDLAAIMGRLMGMFPPTGDELFAEFNRDHDDVAMPKWAIGLMTYGRSGGMMYHPNTFDGDDE